VFKDGVELAPQDLPVEAAASGVELRDFEGELVFKDDMRVHFFGNAVPLRDPEGNVRGSIAAFVDITDRKRAEQDLTLQYELARIMTDTGPMEQLMGRLLSAIGDTLDWDVGGAWSVDRAATCLRCSNFWHRPDFAPGLFEKASRLIEFSRGVGLPGRVWENREATWIEDVTADPNFPRLQTARHEGLRSALGFPILFQDEVLGVIEFFNRKAVKADTSLLRMLAAIGRQVGQFLQRKAIESEHHRLLLSEQSARLQLEEEREILKTVNRSGQRISAELDLQKLVQALTDAATELTGAQFGSFFYNVLDDRGASYMLYTLSGVSREHFADFPMPRATDLFRPTFQGEGIVRIDDVKRDPRYGKNAPYHGMPAGHLPVTSYLAVPVLSRSGEVLGGLFFGHSKPSVFSERHELIVEGLAAQAAIAIDNARLYETAQKARREAEVANRLKDEFLATVSHELRTPLNAILGWARLLRGDKLDPVKQARALEVIERNALAQQQIIEDILDVSRIITGKVRLEIAPIELAAVVQAAIDSVKPAADAKGIQLQTFLNSGTNLVVGDSNRLQQVVWNLLSNAVKFTPPDGRVEVAIDRANSYVEVSVRDTGHGISKEFLPFVFERFRQADSSTTRQFGGLGLGLAIVRHLTELHGGGVSVASPGEGQGATFTVKLPLAMPNEKRPPLELEPHIKRSLETRRSSEHRLSVAGIKVLAVDDEAEARELLTVVLTESGAEVRTVASTHDALAVLEDWKPDVLISDIGLPREDGYTLIRRIRSLSAEQGGKVPAVALTAYARSEDRVKALAAGYQTHVTKPVDPSEIIAVVASLSRRTGQLSD
jgi:signal transduction histidine kinase/ActR/RegA family two-component response regulator